MFFLIAVLLVLVSGRWGERLFVISVTVERIISRMDAQVAEGKGDYMEQCVMLVFYFISIVTCSLTVRLNCVAFLITAFRFMY
jgi:hypothetical protein